MNTFRRGLKTIRIIGKGRSWCQAPSIFFREHGDDEELWGVNTVFTTHRNLDRSFLMHDPRQELVFEDRFFFERARAINHPLYTNRKYEVLGEMNRAFPVEAVMETAPIHYFTNVVCWMLALATMLEPEEIYLHGVDMHEAFEYANERGAVEFWVGVAIGKGIKVHLPENTAVCTTESKWGSLYGFVPLRKKTGFILDYQPDYRGFNKPEVLDNYMLITKKEYDELNVGRDPRTGGIEGHPI